MNLCQNLLKCLLILHASNNRQVKLWHFILIIGIHLDASDIVSTENAVTSLLGPVHTCDLRSELSAK